MKYPVAIEPGASNESWGVAVPDLAGCFSAGDRCLDEAIENVKQAIQLWIEVALDRGQEIPKPSSLRELQKKKEFKGWANCTWSESEGLFRQEGESKEDFCNRVYQATKKQFLWFD
jgi:predicted RNase H-like HicB family nuclease